jgi:hypothetical protein
VRPRSGIVGRLLRAALASAILASSSFHFHPSEPAAGSWEAPDTGILLRSVASHPDSPLHVESVGLERAPRCLDCLLRQKDHALRAPTLALANLERVPTGAPPAIERSVLRRAGDPGQPRGPPLV